MKLHKTKWFAINFICLLVLIPFQNCSNKLEGFKATSLNSTSSADSTPISEPLPADPLISNFEMIQAPPLTTSDNFAKFVFQKTGTGTQTLTIKCSLDNAPFTNCVSVNATINKNVDFMLLFLIMVNLIFM